MSFSFKGFLVPCLFVAATSCGEWTDAPQQAAGDTVSPLQTPLAPLEPTLPQTPIVPLEPTAPEDPGQSSKPITVGSDTDDDEPEPEPPLTQAMFEPTGVVLAEQGAKAELVDWLSDKENEKTLSQVGSLASSMRELHLHSPVTLSFSSYASKHPFLIRTNGHDVTLIGNDFGYLKIDTSNAHGHSGHVRLYTTAKVLPEISTSGSAGAAGANGKCREGLPCYGVGEPAAKLVLESPSLGSETKTIEQTWDWQDANVREEWRNLIRSSVLKPPQADLNQLCAPQILYLHVSEPKIQGKVKLRQVVNHPVVNFDQMHTSPIDASFYAGESGGIGFDAGNISIVQVGQEDKKWIRTVSTSGGMGGVGGRHFMSPASEKIEERRVSSSKISEQMVLDELSIELTVTCPTNSPFGSTTKRVIPLRFRADTLAVSTDLFPEFKELVIPALSAGRDLPAETQLLAAWGQKGRAGTIDLVRAKSFAQWKTAIHPNLPLPQSLQAPAGL